MLAQDMRLNLPIRQKKSYYNKGLDSKVSTPEVIIKDKENQRIHCR